MTVQGKNVIWLWTVLSSNKGRTRYLVRNPIRRQNRGATKICRFLLSQSPVQNLVYISDRPAGPMPEAIPCSAGSERFCIYLSPAQIGFQFYWLKRLRPGPRLSTHVEIERIERIERIHRPRVVLCAQRIYWPVQTNNFAWLRNLKGGMISQK